MATDIERLVVQLSADFKKYENALNKAMGVTNRQARNIERRFQSMNRNLSGQFTSLGRSLAGAFALAGGIRGAQTLIDTSTQIQNALKVAGLEGENLTKVYDKLFASAQKNAVPLEAMATLYARIAQAQDALNVSQDEIVNFTDKIGVALRVAGASSQEAAGALLQLSQAIGSGIVRAEEYNSINEGARPILQAVAAGLKEAGGDVAKLRNLVMDGKVSSEAFFRAFEAGAPILEKKVANAEVTVSQHLIRLRNVLIDAAGDFDKGSGAAEAFGKMLSDVADIISQTDFSKMGEEIAKYIGLVNDARIAVMSWLQAHGAAVGRDLGIDAIGEMITGGAAVRQFGPLTITSSKALQRRIDEAFGNAIETAGGLTERAIQEAYQRRGQTIASGKTSRLEESKPRTVSLDDYDKPSTGTKGSKSTKQRADDYERLSRRINESVAAMQAENAVLAGMNPLVNDYGYALEKARVQQELLTAAKKAGVEVTPALEKEIEDLAHTYAFATVEAAKLVESHDKIRESAEEALALAKDVTRDLIDGFIEGKSAADIMANALKKIGNHLINDILNNLFKIQNMGGGGGGFLSGLLSLFGGGFRANTTAGAFFGAGTGIPQFAGGTNYAPGGLALVGEKGPELVNLPRGSQVIPNHRLNAGGGQSVVVNFNPVIDARGADPAAIQRLETGLAKVRAEIPAQVVESVRKAQKSNVKLS